jgi:hypothetical protein
MRKIPLYVSLVAFILLGALLLTGCKDKVNPVSPKWRTWEDGATVPGYVLSEPSGSRADVRAKAQMWDNYYALELTCALDTGQPDDHVFVIGTPLIFAVLISDNSQSVWNGAPWLELIWTDTDFEDPYAVSVYDLVANGKAAPTIDGDGNDEAWGDAPETQLDIVPAAGDNGLREAYLIAAHDSTNIYFKLAWPDPTATMSQQRDMWHFDGSDWTQQGDDDMVVFFFPTDTPPADWDTLGAAVIDSVSGTPNDGSLNAWGWTAGLTNPLGYADDLLATPADLAGDTGMPGFVLNYDADKSYPPFVQDPSIEPSQGSNILLEDEAIPFEDTIRP